ncbi:UNVERIFIED_CONTAM: hypothetical protein HDU68_002245 [Siphonaria sp. JEL0065]|nr:hypothetical protein HDU68_002245 [Siphonaria sp. JEL0065]
MIIKATQALKKDSKLKDMRGPDAALFTTFRNLALDLGMDFENGMSLTQSLVYYAVTIKACLETNLKMHYLKRFVNIEFGVKDIEPKKARDLVYKELNIVPSPETFKSPPEGGEPNIHYDLASDPQRYLPYALFMNSVIEERGGKLFQPFPQQTEFTPKHIQLDTKSIRVLLGPLLKKELPDDKEIIWDAFFKISLKVRDYEFDHTIVSNGYVASMRFIHVSDAEPQRIKNQKRSAAATKARKNKKLEGSGMDIEHGHWFTPDPLSLFRPYQSILLDDLDDDEDFCDTDPTPDPDDDDEVSNPYLRITADVLYDPVAPLRFMKDPPAEPPLPPPQQRQPPNKSKDEFQYFDEVDREVLLDKPLVFIDPGKLSLLTMLGKNSNGEDKFLSYTNRRRLMETRQAKYQRLINKIRRDEGILDLEQKIADAEVTPKTCSVFKFREYIWWKLKYEAELSALYSNHRFRQHKWYGFMNRQRSESRMTDRIAKTYGTNAVLILEDWSISKSLRNFMPTPNKTLRRRLAEKFPVYLIDEFRTSCLDHRTEERCQNLRIQFGGKVRKLHAVLVSKLPNGSTACMNRDKNGCRNIFHHYFSDLESKRPLRYTRGVNIADQVVEEESLLSGDDDDGDVEMKMNNESESTLVGVN